MSKVYSGGHRGPSSKVYAVAIGRTSNVIHETWNQCQANVKGLSGARYKSFPTRQEAEAWLQEQVGDQPNGDLLIQGQQLGVPLSVHQEGVLYVYTDGSYAPTYDASMGSSPKKGGWAVAFVWQGQIIQEWYGHVPYDYVEVTNNVAELYALGQGLLGLTMMTQRFWRHVRVRSDSNYAIKALNGRIEKWKRDGWLTAAKKPVANRALVEALDTLRNDLGSTTSFEHVYGHDIDQYNHRVDHLANEGRRWGAPRSSDFLLRRWVEQRESGTKP